MKPLLTYLLGLLFFLLTSGARAQESNRFQDSVTVYFVNANSRIDLQYGENAKRLKRFVDKINEFSPQEQEHFRIQIFGGASPVGPTSLNLNLAKNRARVLIEYLTSHTALIAKNIKVVYAAEDWTKMEVLVEGSSRKDKEQVLRIVREGQRLLNDSLYTQLDAQKRKLQTLNGGSTYKWLSREIYPKLRYSTLYVDDMLPQPKREEIIRQGRRDTIIIVHDTIVVIKEIPILTVYQGQDSLKGGGGRGNGQKPRKKRPYYLSVRTNLLCDAAAIPHIGVDIYLGKQWSLAGNWVYSRWMFNNKYWYTYGGDFVLKKWWGRRAEEKPLTGHHAGIYFQMITYDFGFFKHNTGHLADEWNFGGGIEYGYSFPIAKRLNIDLTLGVGYLHGDYQTYRPYKDCNYWRSDEKCRWIGPTKAEVTLVWQLGRGNINKKKGGSR